MIPSDIRLYTWVDVEEVLLRRQVEEPWPEWLVWVRSYWDSLTMGIRPESQAQAKEWLSEIYDPRFRTASDSQLESFIILESLPGNERILSVFLEETQDGPPNLRLEPSLARPGVLVPLQQHAELPPPFAADLPPVVAFHSFKGGVGRTTHTIALAQALSDAKQKVLLVDGDLEAPGISWLLEQRLPTPPISFSDLLALAHNDSSSSAINAVQLVADRLQTALVDGIYFLPSFRSNQGVNSLEIRPEHIIQSAENPFLITQILAELGKVLAVDAVIVDLRAGLSELSAGLLLDPRVYRVFVTTASGQSVAGTAQLLELLAARAISTREDDPLPALIVSQVPEDGQHDDLVQEADLKLLQTVDSFVSEERGILPPRIKTSFVNSLLVIPLNWDEVVSRLHRSGIVDAMRPLLEWLPTQKSEYSDVEEAPPSLQRQRESLKEFSRKLTYAESAEEADFLSTVPLRRLASDYHRALPITVIVGAKGSGKTYTFLQIIRRETWQAFVQAVSKTQSDINAAICPVLSSKNLDSSTQQILQQVRAKASKILGFSQPQNEDVIRDHIREGYQGTLHEGQWRERWLDVIAWGVGFNPQESGAGRGLATYLATSGQQLVVVIDGLEDLFQDFTNDKAQQTALRALLQEVPEWLTQQPGRPLGIVTFIRRDMVLAAISQNAAQMMARYDPYALKWSNEEALRLVAWVAQKANVISNLNIDKLQNSNEADLIQALIPLWGKKLGSERSKDAWSARYVIAALSDFRGQIQARDLVRLLYLAAKESVNDVRWKDRVLAPTAIRGALPESSKAKVDEIQVENTALKGIFAKLQGLDSDRKKIPFPREDIGLSLDEMKILEDNGVVIREKDEYFMPEIFRFGLDFTMKTGARPKVLSLARRVRQNS
jgi:MinD-like ATPase involved in chromosome partitioning or flagellar assembly